METTDPSVHTLVKNPSSGAHRASVPSLPVHTYVVRVWVPDRPGALGQVASRIGAALTASVGKNPDTHIGMFLRRLKQLTEAGEAATSGSRLRTIA